MAITRIPILGQNDYARAMQCREANLFGNSNFQVSQERYSTASSASIAGNYEIADMWRGAWNMTTGTYYTSRATMSLGDLAGLPYRNFIACNGTGTVGAGNYLQFYTKVEGYRAAHLRWGNATNSLGMKIGFYARASQKTGRGYVAVRGGSTQYYVTPFDITATSAWQWQEVYIPPATSGTWVTDNSSWAEIGIVFSCGSTFGSGTANTWSSGSQIAASDIDDLLTDNTHDVQINLPVCIPEYLEFPETNAGRSLMAKSYDADLHECMRYYQKSYAPTVLPGTVSSAGAVTHRSHGTTFESHFQLIPPMRTTPTFTAYSDASGNSGVIRQVDGTGSPVDRTATFGYQGSAGARAFCTTGSDNAFCSYHWVANARL